MEAEPKVVPRADEEVVKEKNDLLQCTWRKQNKGQVERESNKDRRHIVFFCYYIFCMKYVAKEGDSASVLYNFQLVYYLIDRTNQWFYLIQMVS